MLQTKLRVVRNWILKNGDRIVHNFHGISEFNKVIMQEWKYIFFT